MIFRISIIRGIGVMASVGVLLLAQTSAQDIEQLGPQVGDAVPDFSLVDQTGRSRDLRSIMGPNGALLVFNRSADWCPYCKTQLVELQSRYADLQAQGLGLASILYEAPETLSTFAAARGIEFPLLSDVGSKVIRQYGILNREPEPGTRSYGIPYPGTFVLDASGRVTARFFEPNHRERFTVASITARLSDRIAGADPGAIRVETAHLEVRASARDPVVAPGNRIALVLEVIPKPDMHVYAPGDHPYQVIRLRLDGPDFLRPHELTYPPAATYHFEPLDETVPVYQHPFRLTQEVTVPVSQEIEGMAAPPGATLTIEGALEYQACDHAVCYFPTEVPVSWELTWRPLVRD